MKTTYTHPHRGELLENAVKQSPLKITRLAELAGLSRSAYYHHIKKIDLSFDLLERYGKVLHHDFSQDLPAMKKYTMEDPQAPYAYPKTLNEAIAQIDYWRNKYIRLLERGGEF